MVNKAISKWYWITISFHLLIAVSWFFFPRAPYFLRYSENDSYIIPIYILESKYSPSFSVVSFYVVSSQSVSDVSFYLAQILSLHGAVIVFPYPNVSTYDIASNFIFPKQLRWLHWLSVHKFSSSSAQTPSTATSFSLCLSDQSFLHFIQLGVCKATKWEYVVFFFFAIMFHISFHLISFAIVLFI